MKTRSTMCTLVTGGGLIGSLTAEMLVQRGERVVLADLRMPDFQRSELLAPVSCDVTDLTVMEALFAEHRIERIVHTAAMLSTGMRRDPRRGVEVNVMGTANVLELARRCAVRRVVVASSTTAGYAGFGRHGTTEIEEDLSLHMISERPASVYAMTKVACEQLALLYNDLYGLDVVILRYGAVMGGDLAAPTSVPGQLLAQLAKAPRTGDSVLVDNPILLWSGTEEFVDARDCARANLRALDAEAPMQRVYNVASGLAVSMPEFLAAAEKTFPGLKTLLPPLPETGFAGFPCIRPAPSSTAAATRELGFSCRYTLEDSLRYWGTSSRQSAKAGTSSQPKEGQPC